MADVVQKFIGRGNDGASPFLHRAALIPVLAFGMALSLFFAISYVLCVLFYLWFPEQGSGHALLTLLLPWFTPLSWGSFLLGLIESFSYGWYVALVFGPLYNFFAARLH